MKKGAFRDNIQKIVRLLPRPKMDGKLIAQSRNYWLIVQEYGEGEGIEVLNKITNHGGNIPYDSIREWREPDMVILSAQVNVGKDGLFEITPFLDGPETEMQPEDEEILPERLSNAEAALKRCTPEQVKGIRALLIQETMTFTEMLMYCENNAIPDGHKFFPIVNDLTSFLEKTPINDRDKYRISIKPGFAPILRKLLLDSKKQIPPSHLPSDP
jgi:hypothetical protein